jgi:hypothetical protein
MRQILVETATGAVLQMGLEDQSANPQYDAGTHTIITDDVFAFDPLPYDPDTSTFTQWYWDGSTFTTTVP